MDLNVDVLGNGDVSEVAEHSNAITWTPAACVATEIIGSMVMDTVLRY